MANKALATRQKMRMRVEPSQKYGKPRNPIAVAASQRAAGSHRKSERAVRQQDKRALQKSEQDDGDAS